VELVDGRLTVHVVDAVLHDVIGRLVELNVIDVVGQDRLVGTVSADVVGKPVVEALDVLLAGYNFVIAIRPGRAAGSRASYVLRIHSKQAMATAQETGAIPVAALEAALQPGSDVPADEPDRDDPDPDVEADSKAAAEEFEIDLIDRERRGELSPNTSFEELVEHAQDDNPLVRMRALDALVARDVRQALPSLLRALRDDERQVAHRAVDVLSRLNDAESLKGLGDILTGDDDTIVRMRAMAALARRGDPGSAADVEAVIDDPNQIIRESAAQMLSAFKRRGPPLDRPSPRPPP
jgi:hypothetical protein